MAVELFKRGGSQLFHADEVSLMLENGWHVSPEEALKAIQTVEVKPKPKKARKKPAKKTTRKPSAKKKASK